MKYDISSLEVKVGKDDVKYELDHSQAFKYGLESGFSSLFDLDYILGADFYLSENLYKEIQKESYRDLFRYYKNMNQQYDDGLGYKNLKVDDYTMSYSAEDGDYTYHRYNSSVPSVK